MSFVDYDLDLTDIGGPLTWDEPDVAAAWRQPAFFCWGGFATLSLGPRQGRL